jgi:predicted ABC-type ATPase
VPNIIILAGPNGAGKTTFGDEYVSADERTFEFVNADEIARDLDTPGIYVRSDVVAARKMLRRVDELVRANANFLVETTLATLAYAQKIPSWHANGYVISLVYLRLGSAEEAVTRVRKRVPPADTVFRKLRFIAVLKKASATLRRSTSLPWMNGIYGKVERVRSYSLKPGTRADEPRT